MLTSGGSSANTTWLAALKSSPVPAAVTDSSATRMVGSDLKRCTTYGAHSTDDHEARLSWSERLLTQ